VIIGYAMSFIAFGAFGGAILCGKMMLNFNTRNLMLYWSLYGIAFAILPVCAFTILLMLLGCFALGGLGAFIDVILPTNIQRLSTAKILVCFRRWQTLARRCQVDLAGTLALVASAGTSLTIIGLLIASIAFIGKIKTVPRHA
jgi:DHA3 family macrolide efflux protein-like MFS transporter